MEDSFGAYIFTKEEIFQAIEKTIKKLEDDDMLFKKFYNPSKLETFEDYMTQKDETSGKYAILDYVERLKEKRIAFKESWIRNIKLRPMNYFGTASIPTFLDVCDVFSMKIRIHQDVTIINEEDLEIDDPFFYFFFCVRDCWFHNPDFTCLHNILDEEYMKKFKQLLQDLGYFFITKGDDTHIAIIKAHLMKQLNK